MGPDVCSRVSSLDQPRRFSELFALHFTSLEQRHKHRGAKTSSTSWRSHGLGMNTWTLQNMEKTWSTVAELEHGDISSIVQVVGYRRKSKQVMTRAVGRRLRSFLSENSKTVNPSQPRVTGCRQQAVKEGRSHKAKSERLSIVANASRITSLMMRSWPS